MTPQQHAIYATASASAFGYDGETLPSFSEGPHDTDKKRAVRPRQDHARITRILITSFVSDLHFAVANYSQANKRAHSAASLSKLMHNRQNFHDKNTDAALA